MKCQDLLRMLNDYIDGEVDPSICDEFGKYLEDCNPCSVVVDSIKKTVTLYKGTETYEIPLRFRERLHTTLREKWKQIHSEKASGESGREATGS